MTLFSRSIALAFATTLGLSLAACDSKQENAMEAEAQATREAADATADAMENKADAVREAGDAKADAMENKADKMDKAPE